ncbi:MAG: hypothetical protein KJS97_16655 [Alphaproteobacteria bacterium]|nr:hypothetical protein [Alphaproteobacteria bacterium]
MAKAWTPEQREAQRQAIQRWRPWEKTTGPKTEDGKRRSAMRAYKGGQRAKAREIARALREHRRELIALIDAL